MQNRSYEKISPLLQERMVYLGQYTNYEEGVQLLNRFYGITMSKTQHFRITNYYGEQVSSIMENEEETSIPETLPSDTVVYAESDGSMILTREKKEDQPFNCWEEVKLLRTYKSGDKLSTLKRSMIEKSEYVAHLGNHQEFESKAEQLLDKYEHLGKNLVFMSDGACWIHKWQTESYPKATQILDYYHVCEHMAAFALIAIPNETERKIWLDKRKEELLESQSERVCKQIRKIANKEDCNKITKEANNLINYFVYYGFFVFEWYIFISKFIINHFGIISGERTTSNSNNLIHLVLR